MRKNRNSIIRIVVMIAAVAAAFPLWNYLDQHRYANKPTSTKTTPKAISQEENILPNEKRIEEIATEAKRIETEYKLKEKERAAEKTRIAAEETTIMARAQILDRLSECTTTVGGEDTEWDCTKSFKKLARHPDIVNSLEKLSKLGVKILIASFPSKFSIIGISGLGGGLEIWNADKISQIKKFLGLSEELNPQLSPADHSGKIL